MLKNKTHRIISISPNNHQSSIKNGGNKSGTPIKPLHEHTRTNTIRTSAKPDGSIAIDDTCKETENKEKIIDSVYISSYKQDGFMRQQEFAKAKKQPNYEEILSRIGKAQDNVTTTSHEVLKKSQINQLRQVIKEAKALMRVREESSNGSLNNVQTSKICIESLSISIRQQIFSFFSLLHKQLYNKEKQLYEELEEKVYLLNEKHMAKCFQQSVLKSSVQKCEVDVNSNYQEIIKELQMNQLSQICKSYTQKMQFYMDLIQTEYTLKVSLPSMSCNLLGFLPALQITLQKQQPKDRKLLLQVQNVFIEKKMNKQQQSKNGISKELVRQSLGRHTKNAKSNLEESTIVPFRKIKMREINQCNESKPQIASARGKY